MRVLIADDQREVGLSLADMVRYCGHEIVAVVSSGLDAINAYSRHHPDLVLMDYRMPKLNGGTACRHILAKDPDARVILVSGWSPSDGADQSGALNFLPKPVDLNRLNATLQSVVLMLPPLSPAEYRQFNASPVEDSPWRARTSDPMPEIHYPPDSIDYSQAVAEPLPGAPLSSKLIFSADAPPSQPDFFDYFTPISDPLPIEPPSSETNFPIETPQTDLQQAVEIVEAGNASQLPVRLAPRTSPAKELVEEKKSRKPRSNRRRVQRSGVR